MTVVNGKSTIKPSKRAKPIIPLAPKKPFIRRTSPDVVIPVLMESSAPPRTMSYDIVQPLPLPALSGAEQFRANFAITPDAIKQDPSKMSVTQLVSLASEARKAIAEARSGIEGAISDAELQYYTEAFKDGHDLYDEACRHLRREGFALPEIPSDIPRNSFLNPDIPDLDSQILATTSSYIPKRLNTTQTTLQVASQPVIEPVLCGEQQDLVNLILQGHNVFYTGSAGCGKSTVLKKFVKELQDKRVKVDIVAPTGRAALDIKGSTTWTYAGWWPDSFKRPLDELLKAAHGKFVRRRLNETDVLVIDEISMVENLHFERLDAIMREARGESNRHLPFGGVQLIVTGDFCQLPPVKPFEYCITCGSGLVQHAVKPEYKCTKCDKVYHDMDKWAFRSKAWELCEFKHVHLTQIHRQNDEVFIKLLQKCRVGTPLSQTDIDLLLDHPSETENAVKLLSTRDEVRTVNKQQFDKLKTERFTFRCYDIFDWQQHHPHLRSKGKRNEWDKSLIALRDHRFEPQVELKEGMLVILLVNLELRQGLINGSQGTIIGWEKYDPAKLPKATGKGEQTGPSIGGDHADMKEGHVRRFIETAETKQWPIVKFHNGQQRTIYADCTINELGDEKPCSLLSRTQIPLAPAWAMSIHKSQGMTLDRVIVDLARGFEEGQMYVALSRARNLKGLKVIALPKAKSGGNPQVKHFLKEKFGIE